MVTTNAISRRRQTSHLKHPKIQSEPRLALNHAVRLIHAVWGLAGSPTLVDENPGRASGWQGDSGNPQSRHRPCLRLADGCFQLSRHLGPGRLRLTPTHGYEPTREATKSWRRECPPRSPGRL